MHPDLLDAMLDAAGDPETLDALAEVGADLMAPAPEQGFGEEGDPKTEEARARVEGYLRDHAAKERGR